MNILITGATGFLGGYLVEQALTEGLHVVAAVRRSSNRQYLNDPRIHFVEMNLADEASLLQSLKEVNAQHGGIDYVMHNAGLTKTTNNHEYDTVNYDYSVHLIKALEASGQALKKFTLTSSMAAAAPGKGYAPIRIDDKGEPVSAYGKSKKKIETYIEKYCSFPYLILRPPPVFGPRDRDMFTVFELINQHLELYVGRRPQRLSFIYVKDLALAMLKATLSEVTNKKYFLSDNKHYDNRQFSQLIKKYLNKKTLQLKLPLSAVYTIAFFAEFYTKITGRFSPLNLEKVKELKCSNWVCDASAFYKDINVSPQYSLEQAIAETVDWYKQQHWLS